jgi:predicted enzyme related to lactoylglutathione lyase
VAGSLFVLGSLGAWALWTNGRVNADPAVEPVGSFVRTSMDFGLVVSDAKKSVEFYTQVVGMTEAGGFSITADVAEAAGLCEPDHPFDVRVLVLGEGPTASRLKIIQFADAETKRIDNSSIHAALGVRYLTIQVTDMDAAIERAKTAGAQPIARGPAALPNGVRIAVFPDPDGNFVELVGR